MSVLQTGSSPVGISGEIGQPDSGAKFPVTIYLFKRRGEGELRPRMGRTSGGADKISYRHLRQLGTFSATGKASLKKAPEPAAWRGAETTITLKQGTDRTVTHTIVIDSFTAEKGAKTTDLWDITITARIVGEPLYSNGWDQETDPTASKSDIRSYVGTSFQHDPSTLQTNGIITVDYWTLSANTDATLHSRLVAAISAWVATGFDATLKVRPSVITQDAADGGVITLNFGLTTTAEDVINPQTVKRVDPQKIHTGGTVAAINATPSIPTVSGNTLVERETTFQELNDNNILEVTDYAQKDTRDDIEMDGTQAKIDETGIESEGQDTAVYASSGSPPADAASPDASLKAVATMLQDINRDRSKKITFFEVNDSVEKWLFARTRSNTDPSDLKDQTILGAVFERGSEPSPPGSSGLVLHHKELFDITSDDTSNLQGVLWFYGELTTAAEETFPHFKKVIDLNKLTSEQVTGAIFTTGSPPGDPSSPDADLVLVDKTDTPLTHASASNKSLRLYQWGLRDTKDAVEMDGTHAKIDESSLESSGQDTTVFNTGDVQPDADSPDASLKAIARETQELNRIKSKLVTYFDVNSSAENVIFKRAKTTTDPSGLKSVTIKGAVHATGSVPGAPGASGLVLHDTETITLTSPDTSNQSVTFWLYAELTTADDETFPRTKTTVDANLLTSEATSAAIFTTGSPPSDPSAPTNLVKVDHADIPLTNASASNKSIRVYRWGLRDSKDAIEMDESEAETDAHDLVSREKITEVFTTLSGEPAPAAPTVAEVKKYTATVKKINRLKSKRTTDFRLTDSLEDIQRPETRAIPDPNALQSEAQQMFVYQDGDPPPDESDVSITLPADVEVDSYTDQQINDGQWKRLVKWAINNSKNLWERLKKKVTTDVGHVGQEAIIVKVLTTATPAADDTYNPDTTNLEFATAEVIPISATKFAHIYTFSPLSPKDRAVEGFGQVVDDPVTLLVGDDQRRIIDANATTAAPAVSGRVCVRRLTRKIGRTLYQHDYYYGFRSVGDEHEAKETTTETDLSALESTAMTADVWLVSGGAPSDPTLSGFVLVTKRDVEIENPLYRLRIYKWGLVTNQTKLENQRTRGEGDPYGDDPSLTAAVVASSGSSAQTLADAYTAANTDPLFAGVDFETLTDAKALRILKKARDNKQLVGGGAVSEDKVAGIPDPGGSGWGDPDAVQKAIRLSAVTYGGGGATAGLVQPITIWRARGLYEFTRYYLADDVAAVLALVDIGSTNDATWHGFPAHTLMFGPPRIMINVAIASGHRILKVRFILVYDNYQHFSDANLGVGWTDFNVLVSSPGYFDPAVYVAGGTFMTISWPPEDDFTALDA
jgi:hypothetical protein